MQSAIPTTHALTPSEVVFLNGEQFAKPAKIGLKLPRSGAIVEADELAVAMVGAALLANRKAGAARLEVAVRKRMFGLLKDQVLQLVPLGANPRWPAGTLEERIWSASRAGHSADGITVKEVVGNLFTGDVGSPYMEVRRWVEAALGTRGVLDAVSDEVTLDGGTYTVETTRLNAVGAPLAERHPSGPIQEMLAASAREQPQGAASLAGAVRSGLSSRTESSGSGYPDVPDYD